MPTAVFDASRAKVDLRSDSTDWGTPTDRVTFQRRTASGAWEIVPGYESIPAVGSYALAVDQEMPLDSLVTYRALNRSGVPSTTEATVDTSGADWGLWMKVRTSHSLTQKVNWSGIGSLTEDALGDAYQVHGGPAVAQFDGTAAETVDLTVWVEGRQALFALRNLLKADRRVFLQTANPQELEDGWWFIERATYTNPDQRTLTTEGDVRYATFVASRIEAPAGAIGGAVGQSYSAVRVAYGTYAPITASGKDYWQIREGV